MLSRGTVFSQKSIALNPKQCEIFPYRFTASKVASCLPSFSSWGSRPNISTVSLIDRSK